MKRVFVSYPVDDLQKTKYQLLNWAQAFDSFCFLDSQQYSLAHQEYECMLGVGIQTSITAASGHALQSLQTFAQLNPDWLFGHFGFDLKSETEQIATGKPAQIPFPDLFFFVPKLVILLKAGSLAIGSLQPDHQQVREAIQKCAGHSSGHSAKIAAIRERFSRSEYLEAVARLQAHILRGDCYEINFCQEFYAAEGLADPVQTYWDLSARSPMPFAAFYKLQDKYLICASPERYLKRKGAFLLSQPIKGTSARNLQDADLDQASRDQLSQSAKDRSENVMVVDLVRNDLSKVCQEGSVELEELWGVYSFPQVHQMMSSVIGRAREGLHWTEFIRATFPMGSMTGAPKRKVLDLIERYEKTPRGLYSGSLGYVSPEQDFDFNVVIRSILYDPAQPYLSYCVGSGITYYSDPEAEYDECLLKGAAIKKVLTG